MKFTIFLVCILACLGAATPWKNGDRYDPNHRAHCQKVCNRVGHNKMHTHICTSKGVYYSDANKFKCDQCDGVADVDRSKKWLPCVHKKKCVENSLFLGFFSRC